MSVYINNKPLKKRKLSETQVKLEHLNQFAEQLSKQLEEIKTILRDLIRISGR